MLTHYLLIGWRHLRRHRLYSAISIVGLAIAMAFCILSLLFVCHERSFDTFHERADRIYLVWVDESDPGASSGATPLILAPVLREHVPSIEGVFRVSKGYPEGGTTVRYGDKSLTMSGLRAEPGFFELFSFPRVAGDPQVALGDLQSVVISEEMARTYFGDEEPLGRSISIALRGRPEEFAVGAIVSVPSTSSMQFDFLLPLREAGPGDSWWAWNVFTYVILPAQADPDEVQSQISSFLASFFADRRERGERFFGDADHPVRLLPLRDHYLNTILRDWPTVRSHPAYAHVLSGIALAVLLIACTNFINLSLGLSSTRFREVGMRKLLGGHRIDLVKQFWGEAALLSALSLAAAVGLVELLMPAFCSLTGRDLRLDYAASWPALAGIGLGVSLAAASCPALALSAYRPVEALRGRLRFSGASWFGRALLLAQFAVAIALIVVTLMMVRQLALMREMELGFNAEQVVVIDTGQGVFWPAEERRRSREEKGRILEVFRQVRAQHPTILSVSMGSMAFGKGTYYGTMWYDDSEGYASYLRTQTNVRTYVVDYDYLKTLEIDLIAGRDFLPDFPADEEESILVNEALVEWVYGGRDPLVDHPACNDG